MGEAGGGEGSLRFSLRFSASALDTAHDVDPDQFEPGIPLDRQARSHALDFVLTDLTVRAEYGLRPWLDVGVEIPTRAVLIDATFRDAAGQELADFESIHHRDETVWGLGDVAAHVGFRWPGPRRLMLLRVGLSLPTGEIEADPFARGRAGQEHQHVFLGTGTVDPRVSLTWARAGDSWSGFGSVQASGALYENSEGYRAGWRGSLDLGAASGFGQKAVELTGRVGLFAEWPSRWSGEAAKNSGRWDLVPALGAMLPLGPDLNLTGEIARPVNITHEGGQLEIPWVVTFGAHWTAMRPGARR